MEFNPKEWHHGYLGIVLIIVDLFLKTWVIGIIGGLIVIDELSQIFIFGQQGGLLHHLYSPFYKFKIVKKVNNFFDKLVRMIL